MSEFFDPNNLSDAQRARWDAAMASYKRIIRANEERRLGRPITDAEWDQATRGPSLRFPGYQPGHPKSALFFRLLEGKSPLPYAPPCSFAMPWYDVVESELPMLGVHVSFPDEAAERKAISEISAKFPGRSPMGVINIEQTPWEVLGRDGDAYIVSFGEWLDQGLRWRLSRVSIPATESAQFIVCHHDRSKTRITTHKELMAEAAFHINAEIATLTAYLEAQAKGSASAAAGSPAPVSLDDMWRQQQERHAAEMIQQRVSRGLEPLPSPGEVRALIKERAQQYLRNDASFGGWRVDSDGNLHSECWELEALRPRARQAAA